MLGVLVSIINSTLTWTTGCLTCAHMLMYGIAYGVGWGGGCHKRVCSKSWRWEKNPLSHWGIEPASPAYQSDALPTTFPPLSFLAYSSNSCLDIPVLRPITNAHIAFLFLVFFFLILIFMRSLKRKQNRNIFHVIEKVFGFVSQDLCELRIVRVRECVCVCVCVRTPALTVL